MFLASRTLYRACLTLGLLATVLVAGCHHAPPTPPPPPPAPAPAPSRPTVTLSASPTTIQQGGSATLSWSSTDATQLSIAPDTRRSDGGL